MTRAETQKELLEIRALLYRELREMVITVGAIIAISAGLLCLAFAVISSIISQWR